MSYLTYSKDFKGVADAWMRDAKLYLPIIEFVEAVMTRPSELSIAQRELIAAYVSQQNACDFCVGAHRATLVSMDVPGGDVDGLLRDVETAPFDEKFKAVLRFSRKLNQTGVEITRADVDRLTEHGWSEQTVEDIINVVALFNYVNRLIDGMGIEGSRQYFEYVGSLLASDGYRPLVEMARKKAA